MIANMFVATLVALTAYMATAQNQEPCSIGLFMNNQDGSPVGDFGPISSLDAVDCLFDCIDGSCACTRNISLGCTQNAYSDCDIQSICCWHSYWQNNALTDEVSEGLTLGQQLCDLSRDNIGIPEGEIKSLTLQVIGKYNHCGDVPALNGGWHNIQNAVNSSVPALVCCDQVGSWLPC